MKYRRPKKIEKSLIVDILNIVSGDAWNIDLKQFLVAEYKNKIVGCVRIKEIDNCFELASLAVLPEYRNQGFGANLVKRILAIESKRPIYLLCHKKNELFYNKVGFRKEYPANLPRALNKEYVKFLRKFFMDNPDFLVAMVIK